MLRRHLLGVHVDMHAEDLVRRRRMRDWLQHSIMCVVNRSRLTTLLGVIGVSMVFAPLQTAYAVRPFVTDDAEVVGYEQVEAETFAQFAKHSFEHNLMFGVGLTPWLELGLGFVHGVEHKQYGIQGPLFHAKASLRELPDNGWTLALTAGGATPVGRGAYEPFGATGFLYGVYTHSVGDGQLLLHANLGVAFEGQEDKTLWSPTVGYGIQLHFVSKLYGVAEIFYSDPFDPGFELGSQLGLRLILNEQVQLDAAFGSEFTFAGEVHPWGTLGLRLVTKPSKEQQAYLRSQALRKEIAERNKAE